MTDLDSYLPAIALGDDVAFGRWLSLAEPGLRAGLRPFAARVDTEAILQEAMLRVWQVAPRHQPDGRPNGLVRLGARIARNLCIDEVRRARVAPLDSEALERLLGEGEALIQSARIASPDPFLREAIEGCREKLPEKPAQALAARLEGGGGEPDATLAERLGMQLNTFLQNFGRARRFLAECLGKRNIDLEAELS